MVPRPSRIPPTRMTHPSLPAPLLAKPMYSSPATGRCWKWPWWMECRLFRRGIAGRGWGRYSSFALLEGRTNICSPLHMVSFCPSSFPHHAFPRSAPNLSFFNWSLSMPLTTLGNHSAMASAAARFSSGVHPLLSSAVDASLRARL